MNFGGLRNEKGEPGMTTVDAWLIRYSGRLPLVMIENIVCESKAPPLTERV